MLPHLRPGDILYLKKIKFQQVKINDLIMVKNGKQIFTHRVIFKTQDLTTIPPPRGSPFGHPRGVLAAYLITRGDNNPQADGKIKPKQIMGKVYQTKRKGQIIDPENFYLLQSTLYFQEIVKVKKAFEKEKIDFVFLKGLPLHLYFERSHPRRIYADCDILIEKADYEKVKKVFAGNGFKKVDTSYSPLHKLLKDKPTEISFFKKVNNFPVVFDIHFEPVFLMNQLGKLDALYPEKFRQQMTRDFLQTKRTIKVQGEQFFILDTSCLILYLCLHFFHHNYRGIFRLELIDKVMRKVVRFPSPLGNPRLPATPGVFLSLSDKIKYYKVQNFVYPVFILLQKYFATPLPDEFVKFIKPESNKLQYIRKNILKSNIFDDEKRIQAGIARFKNIFYLSPSPFWKKLTLIFNLQVIYSVFWVGYLRIKKFIRHNSRNLSPSNSGN